MGYAGELFRQHLYAFHNVLTPEDAPKLSAEEFLKEWMARGQLYARQMSPESVATHVIHALDSTERVDQLVVLPRPQ